MGRMFWFASPSPTSVHREAAVTAAVSARVAVLLPMVALAASDAAGIEPARALVAAAPAAVAQTPGSPRRVATLPLRPGYYVASDTPCRRASNATVSLLQRGGIGGARDFCEFQKIEQTAPGTYRVTQACKDFQDSGPAQSSVVTYTLSGTERFTARHAHGWVHSARRCAPSAMPPAWRDNDIREEPPG